MKLLLKTLAAAALGLFAATVNAETRTLTQDEDWSGVESTLLTGTIDLNGHNLTISQFVSDACTITDSSAAGAGGELRINCATAITKTDTTTITGSLKLVKAGAGTLTWGGGTLAATIPILVTDGVFKLGVMTANVFGDSGTITVKGKGQFDLNLFDAVNSPVLGKTFEIEGDGPDGSGAIYNSATRNGGNSHLSKVILTGDATIGGTSRIDFRGGAYGVTGPDYTLTIKNRKCVSFTNGKVYLNVKRVVCTDGGVLMPCGDATDPFNQIAEGVFLDGGEIQAWSKTGYTLPISVTVGAGGGKIWSAWNPYSITGVVTVEEGATLTLDKDPVGTFADVVNNGTIAGASPVTITGTLRGNGAITATQLAFGGDDTCWHVECNGGGFTEKVNLDAASEGFLANLKKVDVLCGGNEPVKTYVLSPKKGLASVGGVALVVTDATLGLPLEDSTLAIDNEDRLVLTVDRRDPRPAIAVWTGAAGNGRLDDADNWACTNAAGDAVSGLPCEITDVRLNGEIAIQCPAGTVFNAKSITVNAKLTDACDWSGLAMPVSGTIDLMGNRLDLAPGQFGNAIEVTDSTPGGYQLLDSIMSDGTSYINTGYVAQRNTRIEAHFNTGSRSTTWAAFFGAIENDGSSKGVLLRYYQDSNNLNGFFCNSNYKEAQIGVAANTDVDVTLQSGSMTVNNQSKDITTANAPCNYPMYIFAQNDTGNTTAGKLRCQAYRLYSFKIYEGETLVHDFAPARRLLDGKVGLLDVAQSRYVFYGDATGGNFAAGSVTREFPCGELHVSCPENTTVAKTASMKMTGSFNLVKDGAGTFAWNGGEFKSVYQILVTNGVFKLGVTTADVFGSSGPIIVKGKGQFDLNLFEAVNSPVLGKTFEIEGDGPDGSGAIYNSSTKNGSKSHLSNVILTGDATIGGNGRIDFRGGAYGVTGPDYTLTIKNKKCVCFSSGAVYLNVRRVICTDGGVFMPAGDGSDPAFDQIAEGVFLVNGGEIMGWRNNRALPFSVTVGAGGGKIWSSWNPYSITGLVTVEEGATLTLDKDPKGTLTDVVNNGTIAGTSPVTITGTLRGNGAITATQLAFDGNDTCWHVECDDSGFTEKVSLEDASDGFLAGLKKMNVISSGNAAEKTYDLAPKGSLTGEQMDAIVLTVVDASSGLPIGASHLAVNGDRLVLNIVRDLRPVIAVWTGAAGNGDLADPGNWACTNSAGRAVSGDYGVPCEITDVYLNGEVAFQFPADTTFRVNSITANVKLTAACDWSGLTMPLSGKIDLMGNRFDFVPGLIGNALEITDSSAAGAGGELHLNCVTDFTKPGAMTLSGSLKLVKEGAGTFTWGAGTFATANPILITDGVFKLGVTTANVFGDSGTITVKGKGQFDLNYGTSGNSPVLGKTFEIEGDGPDGSGAINNSATGNASASHLSKVILTGDATIGGTSRIDFRGGAYGVTGPDYTLTIKNKKCVCFTSGAVYLNVRRVICTDGGIFMPAGDGNDPAFDQIAEGVFLMNGGEIMGWRNNRALPFSVTVGAGGGKIWSSWQSYSITGLVTVEEGATLTLDKDPKGTFADVVNNGTIAGTCPATITGALSGTGAITATQLTFGGADSCWHIDINRSSIRKASLENAPAGFFASLKTIEVSQVGAAGYYDLAPRSGFSSIDGITLRVTDAITGAVRKNCRLLFRDERLVLYVPSGLLIIVQ